MKNRSGYDRPTEKQALNRVYRQNKRPELSWRGASGHPEIKRPPIGTTKIGTKEGTIEL